MVIWLFAGGGEAEVEGLVKFFERHFHSIIFRRKTPARQKPGGKFNREKASTLGYGHSGKSLAKIILPIQLKQALVNKETCDLILVLDDLDCREVNAQRKLFHQAIETVFHDLKQPPLPEFIAFAAPELEAWLIADWENSFAKSSRFRGHHKAMQHWLSSQQVSFDQPESFSYLNEDKTSCVNKLSDLIIKSAKEQQVEYSKATDTPNLLQSISPKIVSNKCPLFRDMFTCLTSLNTAQS